MQIQKKIAAISVALLLIISMGASMVLISPTEAHTPAWDIPTYAYVHAAPNPVGVDQKVNILLWLDKTFDPSIALSNDYRFHNYNLTITYPDGHVETKIFETVIDTTSSQYYSFVPTEVGTYTLDFDFPGQPFNQYSHPTSSDFVNDTFLPSHAQTTLEVQEEPIPAPISSYPLPTEYWTRPIYGENTDWWSISSNWLGTGAPGFTSWSASALNRFPGDAVGPLTNHIMWTKSIQEGGVVGGNISTAPDLNGNTWFEGSAYNQRYSNPIIVAGMLIYNPPVSYTGSNSGPTTCVDLRTGQVLWSRADVPAISFAYIYDVEDPQQHGVYPAILFTSNFGSAYDAFTGDHLFDVKNVPGGGSFFGAGAAVALGPQGEHLRYVWTNHAGFGQPANYTLGQWNSTKLWTGAGFANPTSTGLSPTPDTTTTTTTTNVTSTAYINGSLVTTQTPTTTTSTSVDASISTGAHTRYDWVVKMPGFSSAPSPVGVIPGDIIIYENGTLPGITTSRFGTNSYAPYTYFAVNINPNRGAVGSIMWMHNYNAPSGNLTVSLGSIDPVNRIFFEGYKETMQFVGYSMDTGAKLWTTHTQTPLDYYGNPALPYANGAIAYGKLYSSQLGGIMYCYDTATGETLWTFGNGDSPDNSTNAGQYLAYGNYPTFIQAIGNDVIYTVTTEHTVNTPIYKGAVARAVNATTGLQIWALSDYTGEFFTMSTAIADGYYTFFNGYSNEIYVVGRGPSTTTVEAPLTSVAAGNSIVIQGTVTDISAGTQQNEQSARFAHGVPVASDASMQNWMGYVYQQKPMPTDFTGVTVQLYAVDPNGNYITLGEATTDVYGTFHYTWTTPDVPGDYSIFASFAGTNGYWPSTATTAVNVGEAAATPAPTETPPASIADQYFLPAVAAIIVVIILVGAVIMVMLRQRP
jgi:outer membrane protein assembly factor BamB